MAEIHVVGIVSVEAEATSLKVRFRTTTSEVLTLSVPEGAVGPTIFGMLSQASKLEHSPLARHWLHLDQAQLIEGNGDPLVLMLTLERGAVRLPLAVSRTSLPTLRALLGQLLAALDESGGHAPDETAH